MPLTLTPTVPGSLSLGVTAPGRLGLAVWGLINVTDGFGAVGDGVTDDVAALNAAVVANKIVYAPPGLTFLIGSTWNISASNVVIDFSGSTVKKKATATTAAILITGTNVQLRNLVVDGNKAAGATGDLVKWGVGASGEMWDATLQNGATFGVWSNGATVKCRNVTSNGHTFDGFLADNNGTIDMDVRCSAASNGRAGALIYDAGTGCRVNGSFTRNLYGVWVYAANNGQSDYIYASDNDTFNVGLDHQVAGVGPADWKFGTLELADQGKTALAVAGSQLRLAGASRCQIGTVISRGGVGWAVLFCSGDGTGGTGVGAADCSIGSVIADNTGTADTDPAISFQFGSKRNHIGTASVRGHSWAVTISEELAPVGNDHNTIGELFAYLCPWGVVYARGGSYNHIGRIVARDCGNADPTLAKGLIEWQAHPTASGGNVRGNTIGFLDYADSRTSSTRPLALVRAQSTESGNAVLDGIARATDTDVNDENGGNQVTLRSMLRQTSLDTFESGWGGGADNSTAGQFVEGTKGRRIVSNTGGTANIFKTGLAIDLSSMGSDEWLRWFVYLEVVSDKNASNPIILRMGTDTSNYFQWITAPEALRVNGAQYLRARKGGFTTVGSPSWAAIGRIDFFAVSAAANTFAVTFDNLERIYADRYSRHIGGLLPYGQPVASADTVTATGKLYVNDAGTWKSATIA